MRPSNVFYVELVDSGHDSNISMAKVIVVCRASGIEEVVEGRGYSRRDPRDKNRPSVGLSIAAARAIQQAGHRLEKRINGRIKHQEDIARMKLYAKPRPAHLPVRTKTKAVKTTSVATKQVTN